MAGGRFRLMLLSLETRLIAQCLYAKGVGEGVALLLVGLVLFGSGCFHAVAVVWCLPGTRGAKKVPTTGPFRAVSRHRRGSGAASR